MAETDWFNKPVENSRELILKEAFKLFLQKNVEKVTVPELERVTKLQRGAIFYHFKDKEAIFKDAVKQYFFSFSKRCCVSLGISFKRFMQFAAI